MQFQISSCILMAYRPLEYSCDIDAACGSRRRRSSAVEDASQPSRLASVCATGHHAPGDAGADDLRTVQRLQPSARHIDGENKHAVQRHERTCWHFKGNCGREVKIGLGCLKVILSLFARISVN